VNGALRVLMIDDSDSHAELVAQALREQDRAVEYERVHDASSLRAALEKGGWDVVISEWLTPSFGAVGALDVVKELGIDIPLIVVSNVFGEETASQAMQAGACDYFAKGTLGRLVPSVARELRARTGRMAQRRSERPPPPQDALRAAKSEDDTGASLAGGGCDCRASSASAPAGRAGHLFSGLLAFVITARLARRQRRSPERR
jgi:DNA-binding NtrC family response regulator